MPLAVMRELLSPGVMPGAGTLADGATVEVACGPGSAARSA